MLIEEIGSSCVYQWADDCLDAFLSSNCQFNLEIYQYKMNIFTQTTSTSGAQVNYLTVIDQGRIPLENDRVFKFIFSLVQDFVLVTVYCVFMLYGLFVDSSLISDEGCMLELATKMNTNAWLFPVNKNFFNYC